MGNDNKSSVRRHVDPRYDPTAATTLPKQQLLSLLGGYRDRLESQVDGRGNGQ